MINGEENLVNLSSLLAEEGEWKRLNAAAHFRPKLRRRLPHLSAASDKTVDNYFTEVTSLFSLYVIEDEIAVAGKNATRLGENQNVFEFFLHHLLRFQFPGGHITPEAAIDNARHGIHFKPGRFFIELLLAGQKILGSDHAFGISPAEATWYGTNDLAVLRGQKSAHDVAKRILANRRLEDVDLEVPHNYLEYGLTRGLLTAPGDFVRHARDCLTMLEYAQLATKAVDGYRYLKPNAYEAITQILEDESWFDGYSSFVGDDPTPEEKDDLRSDWLAYANSWSPEGEIVIAGSSTPAVVHSDALPTLVSGIAEPPVSPSWLDDESSGGLTPNQIGQIGEEIAMRHEVAKLRNAGRADLAKQVRKIPDHFGVGYDINSWDVHGNRISIEVKTTASLNAMRVNSLTLTPSEWKAAEQIGLSYLVYRLVLASEEGVTLMVLADPVNRYKRGELDMTPRDGAIVSFEDAVVEHVEVLS